MSLQITQSKNIFDNVVQCDVNYVQGYGMQGNLVYGNLMQYNVKQFDIVSSKVRQGNAGNAKFVNTV